MVLICDFPILCSFFSARFVFAGAQVRCWLHAEMLLFLAGLETRIIFTQFHRGRSSSILCCWHLVNFARSYLSQNFFQTSSSVGIKLTRSLPTFAFTPVSSKKYAASTSRSFFLSPKRSNRWLGSRTRCELWKGEMRTSSGWRRTLLNRLMKISPLI